MELSRLKSMSRSGMLGATLCVFWLSLGFASCSPLEEGRGCIDVSSAGWKEMLDSQFGRQVCLSVAIYPGGMACFSRLIRLGYGSNLPVPSSSKWECHD